MDPLASQQKCVLRIRERWQPFLQKRAERLKQQERFGACEKVAEDIIQDLFVEVLDWALSDFNNQVDYADILLTKLGIKHLLIEAKRPGNLAWNQPAVHQALQQAIGYANEQHVKRVAVSDGIMLYAADLVSGVVRDRLFVNLSEQAPPEELWWVSVHGIYRERPASQAACCLPFPKTQNSEETLPAHANTIIVHPKYHRPATCFAYVPNPSKPSTWKLPYLEPDGTIDAKRLPKAVQCILSNYRGAKVDTIPEAAIPDVLVRLAIAASSAGKMPRQSPDTAEIYKQLEHALEQLERLGDVYNESGGS